ncbi:MAG TPA: serine hydrolase domain-containing protein [Pseudonocardiaceae bacterium]
MNQRHDQHKSGSHGLRSLDQVLRCRGAAYRRDVVTVGPVGHAATIEHQFEQPLDPDLLSGTLSTLARKHQVPGAQLAIHHSGETVAVEVGELQYGTGHPVTREAVFPIGSTSKTFTATVAMILVADGDLELDAPLGDEVPELGGIGNELTLRQMLSHTGGLSVGPDSEEVLTTSIRRYVLDHCCRQNLVLPPGTGFSYSNMGYVLVGHLIEMITGMSWWDAMESILLRPMGIEPAFVVAPERQPLGSPLATGHSVNTAVGRTLPVRQSLALALAPAGGLAVSAMDLVALGLTHLDSGMPALLPAVYAEQMRQAIPHAEPIGWADGWGLGLAMFGNGNTPWVGHFGRLNGTASNLRIDPASGCVVAFTSNANTGPDMWNDLVDELCTAGLPIEDYANSEVLEGPTVHSPGCAGTYQNEDIEWSVEATDTGALSLIDGDVRTDLILFDDLSFSARELPSTRIGRFLRDPITGELERIQIDMYVGRRIRRQARTEMLAGPRSSAA